MTHKPSIERVVVVGNGMVSWKFCDLLSQYDTDRRFSIVVLGEEPRAAYDRVRLTSFFEHQNADELCLGDEAWYEARGVELRVGTRAVQIDRAKREVLTDAQERVAYDHLVLATGSSPFVPPIDGADLDGVFVYRTIEDLESIIEYAEGSRSCAVVGGGLLGLEAANAVRILGLETHIVELADRLMPRQLDARGASLLQREISELGVSMHLGRRTSEIRRHHNALQIGFDAGSPLQTDMVVFSAGIRPRDELARECGIEVGSRGGIVVDDGMGTSDDRVYAIGEAALHNGCVYGLVAPGYDMADVLAKRLVGETSAFTSGDLSAKLKLMGVDVATIGNPSEAERGEHKSMVFQDFRNGVYKKLILSEDGTRLLAAMLVGDAEHYGEMLHYARSGDALPSDVERFLVKLPEGAGGKVALPDTALVCSCNNVSKGAICDAIRNDDLATIGAVKSCTTAGTGCGGCIPMVTSILNAELVAQGKSVRQRLCEHFDYTRQEMFDLIRIHGIKTFDELVSAYGQGNGCEICKPTAASCFASIDNDMILKQHATLQDTNDRFLANIQRRGLYSVIPRVPGGDITPDKLIVLGEIAKKYGLYTKITGGQRIDMLGAKLNQLPDIWEELVHAGFESGHAYAKGIRTVKSCVGSTWCRYGVDDSMSMAIEIEQRYRGLRSPHKLKSAVSGCVRECAEAQSKDFGVIATEKGWNLYVCGNGGAKPRHADLLVSDVDAEMLIRYIDRFLMYYISTADKLTRTSTWVENIEGGIEHVRQVVVEDSLGIAAELESRMQALVDKYRCEWAEVVNDPELRARFRHFANDEREDESVFYVEERGQRRPADWSAAPGLAKSTPAVRKVSLPVLRRNWVNVGRVDDFPLEGGMAVAHGGAQIAVFNFASRGEWYAVQNMCPHRQDMVLARGIVGDKDGAPKVACPMHKKNFSLETGECLTGEDYRVAVFPVRVENGEVLVELPPADELAPLVCPNHLALEAAE